MDVVPDELQQHYHVGEFAVDGPRHKKDQYGEDDTDSGFSLSADGDESIKVQENLRNGDKSSQASRA